MYCYAHNCSNSKRSFPKVAFYKVCQKRDLAIRWIKNSGRLELLEKSSDFWYQNVHFCAEHFEREMFLNPDVSEPLLKIDAVPTIFVFPPLKKLLKSRHIEIRKKAKATVDYYNECMLKKQSEEENRLKEQTQPEAAPSNEETNVVPNDVPVSSNQGVNEAIVREEAESVDGELVDLEDCEQSRAIQAPAAENNRDSQLEQIGLDLSCEDIWPEDSETVPGQTKEASPTEPSEPSPMELGEGEETDQNAEQSESPKEKGPDAIDASIQEKIKNAVDEIGIAIKEKKVKDKLKGRALPEASLQSQLNSKKRAF